MEDFSDVYERNRHYPVDPKYCGSEWQTRYMQFHRSVMSYQTPLDQRKFMVSMPVRAGGADIMLGSISVFLYALLINRVFLRTKLTIEGHQAPVMEHAYAPATFNWTSPDFNLNITACMWPPYDGTFYSRYCDHGPKQWLPNDPQEYTFHPWYFVNDFQKEKFWHSDYNTMLGEDGKKDVIFTASNRGNVLMTFYNPHHNKTLINEIGMKPESAFGCLWSYLFRTKSHVCVEGCRTTMAAIHQIKRERKLLTKSTDPFPVWDHMILAIQIREKGETTLSKETNSWFHCTDQLISEYKTSFGVKEVTVLFINPIISTQKLALLHYKDRILFPTGGVLKEEFHDVLGESDKGGAEAKEKITAVIESARDWEVMSHADVHVVSSRSGFGVIGAMMRVRQPSEYRLYRTRDLDGHRSCVVSSPDALLSYVDQWSGL
jgi:hypothetical protein